MHPVTAAVLRAGVVSPKMLEEMKRWSPNLEKEASAGEPLELDMAASIIEQALQSEEYVIVRETDLEVVRQYATTTRTGVLHMEIDELQQGDAEVTYGKTKLGEYIIAWQSDSIEDLLTNGLSYLVEDGHRVFFKNVRELYFGERKAFMVCTPSTVESNGNSS
jgi:hypothetical protein